MYGQCSPDPEVSIYAYILKLDHPHLILEEFIQCFRWNLHTVEDTLETFVTSVEGEGYNT